MNLQEEVQDASCGTSRVIEGDRAGWSGRVFLGESLTENLDEQMDGLQVCELVVVRVHADAEEETSVSPVNDLVVPELKHHALFTQRVRNPDRTKNAPQRSSTDTSGPSARLACAPLPAGGPIVIQPKPPLTNRPRML